MMGFLLVECDGGGVVRFFGEKILPLVVVTQRKAALVGQRQMFGKVGHGFQNLHPAVSQTMRLDAAVSFFRWAFFRRSKVVNTATGVLEAAP
jgi:hypothetical protein